MCISARAILIRDPSMYFVRKADNGPLRMVTRAFGHDARRPSTAIPRTLPNIAFR